MVVHLDLRKLPLETQIKALMRRGEEPRHLWDSYSSDCGLRHAICVAAYDSGYRDFALSKMPLVEMNPASGLIDAARKVCRSDAPLDLLARLTTVPLRNGGVLHERAGEVLRINFSDGKTAYAKSRNPLQETASIALLGILEMPSYGCAVSGNWVVMESASGRDLCDHLLFPADDTRSMLASPDDLASGVIAVMAFDRIFGMLDRNERGILVDASCAVTPIDHEYMFVYPGPAASPLPMQGKDLVNLEIYLNEMGVGVDLQRHFGGAEKVFRLANRRLAALSEILSGYLSSRPEIDLTVTILHPDGSLLDKAREIAEGGADRFFAELKSQVDYARSVMSA